MEKIETLPARLTVLMTKLAGKLEKSYREGGWTARQIIHHIPDSQMNMYIRLKVALTEDNPTIKPYNQDRWAAIEEGKHGDIEVSLRLLAAIHERIVRTLRGMQPHEFDRTYFHPEYNKSVSLNEMLQQYAWHGNHHLGHLRVIAGVAGEG